MRPLLSAFIVSCSFIGYPAAHAQQTRPDPTTAAEQATPPSTPAPAGAATDAIPDATPGATPAGEPQATPPAAGSAATDQSQPPIAQQQNDSKAPAADAPQEDASAATLDANGKPVELAPCAHKDKECIKKRKALLHHKELGMKIENGTLTVDGWTGKARLNYDIHDVKFLYVSIPGIGTVVASMQQFPNSVQQKEALDGKTLTLKTPDDHIVQLSSDETLVDKKEHVFFVLLDKTYVQPGRFPTMGYGTVAQAPYNWPGARPMTANEQKQSASAPPLPSGMQAKQVQLPCQNVSPGQKPTPVKLNGITMVPEPCKTPAAPPSSTVHAASATGPTNTTESAAKN